MPLLLVFLLVQNTQGSNAIAIGQEAGQFGQGSYAVAIGYRAGYLTQHSNSIVLNASGTGLGSQTSSSLYVNPIRSGTSTQSLYYDTSSKEVVYGPSVTLGYGYVSLTDAATITWSVNAAINNATVTLGGNRTISFSGIQNGMSGTLIVVQDAVGSRTLTLPANSKVVNTGAGAITLSTAANAIDIVTFTYDGTYIYWNLGKNYT
jgi:hypothetical protein